MCKYVLNTKEKCIVSTKGEIMRPSCIDDVIALHAYYLGCGEKDDAQHLLRRVFKGEKVITKMIQGMQNEVKSK
jgi:hypothetical protein